MASDLRTWGSLQSMEGFDSWLGAGRGKPLVPQGPCLSSGVGFALQNEPSACRLCLHSFEMVSVRRYHQLQLGPHPHEASYLLCLREWLHQAACITVGMRQRLDASPTTALINLVCRVAQAVSCRWSRSRVSASYRPAAPSSWKAQSMPCAVAQTAKGIEVCGLEQPFSQASGSESCFLLAKGANNAFL